jgi:hypothetical protein
LPAVGLTEIQDLALESPPALPREVRPELSAVELGVPSRRFGLSPLKVLHKQVGKVAGLAFAIELPQVALLDGTLVADAEEGLDPVKGDAGEEAGVNVGDRGGVVDARRGRRRPLGP